MSEREKLIEEMALAIFNARCGGGITDIALVKKACPDAWAGCVRDATAALDKALEKAAGIAEGCKPDPRSSGHWQSGYLVCRKTAAARIRALGRE